MAKLATVLFCLTLIPQVLAEERDEIFDLRELPKGATVTLPHPAATYISLRGEVKLTSTDLPQMIKISTHSPNGQRVPPVTIAIYDPWRDGVQHLKVQPDGVAVYSFKSLDSIRIVPKSSSKHVATAQLKIESNKPLGISH